MRKLDGIVVLSTSLIVSLVVVTYASFCIFTPMAIEFGRNGYGMIESLILVLPVVMGSFIAFIPMLNVWYVVIIGAIDSINEERSEEA